MKIAILKDAGKSMKSKRQIKMSRYFFVVIVIIALLFSVTVTGSMNDVETMQISQETKYCSFFNNRAPEVQGNLKNCTWFKKSSCCRQEEIDATFGRVKPLRGASQSCQRYTNYLLCYICSPDQYLFYLMESLTVCEEFCQAWYEVRIARCFVK